MAITRRLIEVAVQLAANPKTNQPGAFAESGTDTITLGDHRVIARIQSSGAPSGATANVQVFGMTPDLMNQLATLGMVFNIIPRNTVTILAGDEEGGMSPVFSGTIMAAYGDYNQAPNVPFVFQCNSVLADAVAPAAASSFTGPTDVATIMAGFARQMGMGFENSGVSVRLSNPYFSGGVRAQMMACAEAAGINAEPVNGNVLAIWPKGSSRQTPDPLLIAPPPQGQMVGYPAYTQQGIVVKTLFDPRISFGSLIKVQSSVKLTTETWAINRLDLSLDSLNPKGDWLATISAYNPNYPRPVAAQAAP